MSMVTEQRERKRGVAIVLSAAVAAAAVAVMLGAVAMARPLGFIHVQSNLSRASTLASAHPDLAVSLDGECVGVVWTEEYRRGLGYHKGHVYLRGASETGGGWGDKLAVFPATDSACAYDAAVAVSGTVAHVAYVVFDDTCYDPDWIRVRYRTCDLTTGECDQSQVVASVDTDYNTITWVDIAVDEEENPHIVWAQYDDYGQDGVIWYRTRYRTPDGGTSWNGKEYVRSGFDSNSPAVSWAGGYVHVVWEEAQSAGHQIWYRRRDSSGWGPFEDLCTQQPIYLPGNPDVAARNGSVFVVWDWCRALDDESYCEQYDVVYRRSNDSGATDSWGSYANETREVGTDYLYYVSDRLTHYNSTDNPAELLDESFLDLRPSIALNRDGWPAVVWHADRDGGSGTDYTIFVTYATTGTKDAVSWITPTVLGWGGTAQTAATVGVGQPAVDVEQHLHVAYMKDPVSSDWEVYYDSDEYDDYKHVYLPVKARGG
jgi:hypothetical protein